MAGGAVRPRPPGWRHELGRRARRACARRMVGRPRPRARRRRRRADHVEGGLDGTGALRGRSGACTRATRGADARRPELVGWLRPVADPDDRRAGPAARRLQARLRARSRQRVHARRSTRPDNLRCHSPSAGRPTACPAACSSSLPTVATTCSSASAHSSKQPRPGSTAAHPSPRRRRCEGAHPPDVLIPVEAEQPEARDAAEEERVRSPVGPGLRRHRRATRCAPRR